jgi:hypothetical protein
MYLIEIVGELDELPNGLPEEDKFVTLAGILAVEPEKALSLNIRIIRSELMEVI